MKDKNVNDVEHLEDATCTVIMDGISKSSNDFVVVYGDGSFFFKTDAATLGMAVKLLTKAFADCASKCSEEELNLIKELFTPSEEE